MDNFKSKNLRTTSSKRGETRDKKGKERKKETMNISLNVSKKNKNSKNKLLNFGLNDRKKPKIGATSIATKTTIKKD